MADHDGGDDPVRLLSGAGAALRAPGRDPAAWALVAAFVRRTDAWGDPDTERRMQTLELFALAGGDAHLAPDVRREVLDAVDGMAALCAAEAAASRADPDWPPFADPPV